MLAGKNGIANQFDIRQDNLANLHFRAATSNKKGN